MSAVRVQSLASLVKRNEEHLAYQRYQLILLRQNMRALKRTLLARRENRPPEWDPAPEFVPFPATPSSPLAALTDRERLALTLIAQGCATKEIAFRMGISFKTAACHRFNLMKKLKVRDTVSLVRLAYREGLVQP